jgi:quinol-cytochrome oxidoreductase complex cytochrome b subunit
MASYAPIIGEKIKYALLGGNIVGQGALIRFYVFHCFVLPGLAIFALAVHFWRVRKDGGISGPEKGLQTESQSIAASPSKTYGLMAVIPGAEITSEKNPEDFTSTWSQLVPKEILATIIVLILLNIASVYFNAPLEELANPKVTPNPAKAPWYFLGLQELVHYSAFLGGVVFPFIIVVGLIVLPYLDRDGVDSGIWFSARRRLRNIVFSAFVLTMISLIVIGTFFRSENWNLTWPW